MSKHNARPCQIEWIESLIEQCRVAGVAAFVKQLGTDPRWATSMLTPTTHSRGKNDDPSNWPQALRVREFPA